MVEGDGLVVGYVFVVDGFVDCFVVCWVLLDVDFG